MPISATGRPGRNGRPQPGARDTLSIKILPRLPLQGRYIFIGDVHGCLEELDNLLHAINYSSATDELVFVGNLVGKGPNSIGVVKRAMELRAHCVLGNHEAQLIRLYNDDTRNIHPDDEMARLVRRLPRDCYLYLASLPHIIRIPQFNIIVVHAGLHPAYSVENQRPSDALYMQRIPRDGRSSKRVLGGRPWASQWRGPETVIFGHASLTSLQQWRYAVGLDTGCCYGGHLTAYVVPDRRIVQVQGGKLPDAGAAAAAGGVDRGYANPSVDRTSYPPAMPGGRRRQQCFTELMNTAEVLPTSKTAGCPGSFFARGTKTRSAPEPVIADPVSGAAPPGAATYDTFLYKSPLAAAMLSCPPSSSPGPCPCHICRAPSFSPKSAGMWELA